MVLRWRSATLSGHTIEIPIIFIVDVTIEGFESSFCRLICITHQMLQKFLFVVSKLLCIRVLDFGEYQIMFIFEPPPAGRVDIVAGSRIQQ